MKTYRFVLEVNVDLASLGEHNDASGTYASKPPLPEDPNDWGGSDLLIALNDEIAFAEVESSTEAAA